MPKKQWCRKKGTDSFFETYCTECHDADKQKRKLRLDTVSLKLDTLESAERWQKILNQVNSGEMPPEDARQPEKVAKTEFLDSVANTLVVARKTLSDQHGNITMRRLNRREYKNTIRDLLGVEVVCEISQRTAGPVRLTRWDRRFLCRRISLSSTSH